MESFRRHVIVLAFPFGSHPTTLLSFIRSMADVSPDVKFSFFNFANSNSSIFSSIVSRNITPYGVGDGLPEGYVIGRNPVEPIELFLKAAKGNFKRAIEAATAAAAAEVSCLVSDSFLWFSGEIAEEMKVPWLNFWVPGPRSLLLHAFTDFIRQHMPNSTEDSDKPMVFLPGFSAIRRMDLPEGVIHGDLESPFATMLHKAGLVLPKASAIAINCFEEAEPDIISILKSTFQTILSKPAFNLAPVPQTISDEHSCLQWLDKQNPRSVVYISFGTFATFPPHELVAMAEALQQSGVPFLWSLRGDPWETFSEDFRRTVSVHGKLVPWAPQKQILAHGSVGVFINHGGWNSVMESIVAGVPMICRPFVGDQALNARTVEAVWKVGLGLENGVLTKDGVMGAMKRILEGHEGAEIRKNIEALQDLALKAAQPNGSSIRNFNALVQLVTK